MNQSIQPLLNSAFLRFIEFIDRALLGKTRWIGRTWRKIWENVFDNNFIQNGRRIYIEHCDLIQNSVPKENLLIFDVHNGWEPLCQFLGHPVPAIDFPKGNTIGVFHRRLASGTLSMFYLHLFRVLKGFLYLSLIYLLFAVMQR